MKDYNDTDTPESIEDAEAVAKSVLHPDKFLTHEDLLAGGMKKHTSYSFTEMHQSAVRAKKFKEREAAKGNKQKNVVAPIEVHPIIDEIAERTKGGAPIKEVIGKMAEAGLTVTDRRVLKVLHRGGFRARLISLIAGN